MNCRTFRVQRRLLEYRRFVRLDGHYVLFRQTETEYLKNYLRTNQFLYGRGTKSSDPLDRLADLIALCRASNIRLILYIHPYRARMLESYRLTGMWPLFEEWKRALVRIVDSAATQRGSGTVELWDFSGYNEITTEQVPGPSERGRQMRWYWEAGHHKRELGELALARILGAQYASMPPSTGFGVILNAQNIDTQLETIRYDRQQYAEAHPEEIAALAKLAQSLRVLTKNSTAVP